MSIDEVSAALSAIRQHLETTAERAHGVSEGLAAQHETLARTLSGASNPLTAQALGRLRLATQRAREGARQVSAAAQAVALYHAYIDAAKTTTDAAVVKSPRGNQSPARGRGLRGRTTRPRNAMDYERQEIWAESAFDDIRANPDSDVIAGHLRETPRADGSVGFTFDEVETVRRHIFLRSIR